jgi:transcriptional regulator with XRE-family HTH domain
MLISKQLPQKKRKMELNSLTFLNKKLSFKLLGNYINKKRLLFNYSIEDLSKYLNIDPNEFRKIESGKKFITQSQFDQLKQYLDFDQSELFELNYIVESKYLINMYKVLDENFPK